MHYAKHDSSGTLILLLDGGPFDIHQQFDEPLTSAPHATIKIRSSNLPRRTCVATRSSGNVAGYQ